MKRSCNNPNNVWYSDKSYCNIGCRCHCKSMPNNQNGSETSQFPDEPVIPEFPDGPDEPLNTSCGDFCAQLDYYVNQPENYEIEIIRGNGTVTTFNTKGFPFTHGFAHVNFPECTFTMLGIPTIQSGLQRWGCENVAAGFRFGNIRQVDLD